MTANKPNWFLLPYEDFACQTWPCFKLAFFWIQLHLKVGTVLTNFPTPRLKKKKLDLLGIEVSILVLFPSASLSPNPANTEIKWHQVENKVFNVTYEFSITLDSP